MGWPVRSSIFIPAHKPKWVYGIVQSRNRPDAVVLDLEDAVATHEKSAARAGTPELLRFVAEHGVGGIVRINALEVCGADDIAGITGKGLDAVMVPKAATVDQIREVDSLLTYHEGRAGVPRGTVAILPLPETPQGLRDTDKLAAASSRVKGLVGGVLGSGAAGDFASAHGFWPSEHGLEQNYILSKIVLDSRAAGAMYPIGVVNGVKIDNLAKVKELALKAKTFGFSGVLVIHPTHLPIVDEVFTPTEDELRFYSGILAKMKETEAKGDGAARYQGEMIDYAMLPRAQEVVRDAERAKRRAYAL